jgi:hypothetical protein
MLSKDPHFQRCLNPTCNGGHFHDAGDEGDKNIFTCRDCGSQVCTTHGVPMHTARICAQYDDEKQIDVSRVFIKTLHLKNCPGCEMDCEKDGACDYMACKLRYVLTIFRDAYSHVDQVPSHRVAHIGVGSAVVSIQEMTTSVA